MFTGHRRGARHRRRGRADQGDAIRLTHRAPAPSSSDAGLGRLDRRQRLLPHRRRRPTARHVDRRRHAGDARQDRARRRCGPATGSTSSAPSPPTSASAATSSRATSTASAPCCRRTPSEHWEVVEISLPAELARYLVDKGSITVDGVSLTVVDAGDDSFTVRLIPETLARTTLGPGSPATGSTSRSTSSPSTSSGCWPTGGPAPTRPPAPTEDSAMTIRLDSVDARPSPTSPPARPSSSSTTRTARTRATSSSPRSKATPELMAFTIRHSSGVICVPMPARRCSTGSRSR